MKAPMIPRELIDYPEPQELEAEYAATSAALERAYLAILNMEAHGTPIPMDVLAEAESWIGEQALEESEAPTTEAAYVPGGWLNYGLRGEGWRADCPQCVASKLTCDKHHREAQGQP